MERTELIAVLGVGEHPTTGEVRRARRAAARLLHPDAHAQSSTRMADINAACDEWLAEIRARRDAPPPTHVTATQPSESRFAAPPSHDDARRRRDRPSEVLLAVASTMVLVVVVTGVVVSVLGASAVSLAAGMLLGVGAGGMYTVARLLLSEHRKRR